MRNPLSSWLSLTLLLLLVGCPDDAGVIEDDDVTTDDDDDDDDDVADDDTADDDAVDDDSADDDDSAEVPQDPYIQPEVYVTPLDLEPGGTATIHYYGMFGQEDDLTVHYGFNGWNEVEGVSDMIVVEDHGNTTAYREVAMTPVLDGFELTVDLPTDGRAMHFAFYTTDNEGVETWDNNDDLDYNQSIVFPYIGPILTWNDATDPADGVVISYETSVPCLGTLEYGTTPSLGMTVLGDELSRMHHFPITGLPADSDVYYRVHDSAGHSSDVYSFHTAATNADAFTFAVLGDMQDTGEHSAWSGTVAELQSVQGVDFLLMPGDLTSGDGPGAWWTFFDRARDWFPTVVMMPTPGNHDTPNAGHDDDTSSFERYFDLPQASGDEPLYRFDYGTAAFLSLKSEALDEFAEGEAQWVWAESQAAAIAAAGDRDWVFAYCHVPPYNAGVRHADGQGSVRVLTQLLDGLVDWFFAGHEHLYQRTHPLRFNAQIMAPDAYGTLPSEGIGYIVVPPAGQNPAHEIVHTDSPEADRRDRLAFPAPGGEEFMMDSENGFVLVQVDGTSIDIETWWIGTVDVPLPAHLVDQVSYTK